MLESFGARLRQRREAQDIALIAVANQTKIKLSLLEALERDEISQWPSGFYRRAFVRAYAHAIGLNPDEAVREFQEAFPEQPESPAAPAAPPMWTEEPLTDGGAPTRLRYLFGSAIDRLRRGRGVDDRPVFYEAPTLVAVPAGPRRVIPVPDPVVIDVAIDAPSGEAATEPLAGEEQAPLEIHAAIEESRHVDAEPPAAVVPDDASMASLDDAPPAVDAMEVVDHRSAEQVQADWMAVAELCTEVGRAEHPGRMQRLLAEAVRLLNAVGLIVWVWDRAAEELQPALASGYSDRVLAQLPTVKRDADNPTAAAFQSERTLVIDGRGQGCGALVIPLLAPAGCAGVLALELRPGSDPTAGFSRAAATIFAALLAQLVGGGPAAALERPEFVRAARSG